MQPVSLAGFSYLAGATRSPGRPGRSNMSKLGTTRVTGCSARSASGQTKVADAQRQGVRPGTG
jgi:hypothetical protein